MLQLDAAIVRFFDGFKSRSCLFDQTVVYLLSATMLKGVVLFALLWFALFANDRARARRDELLSVLVVAIFALAAARALAVLLPFRTRPLHDLALGLHPACGLVTRPLDGWSSFPSDHAVLYCMLAAGIWFASRRLGWIAFSYVVVFVLLPRVYLGLHWPSDILAGGALGVGFAQIARSAPVCTAIGRWGEALRVRAPGVFHSMLFVWSYLLATHFDEFRALGRHTLSVLRAGGP